MWTQMAITRRAFIARLAMLAIGKYVGDVLVVKATDGSFWTPADYVFNPATLLIPELSSRAIPEWPAAAMVVWTLAFVLFSLRLASQRAIDSGVSPWFSVFLLVPYANYALISTLA